MIARCELHHKSNDFHTALKDNVKVTDKTLKKKSTAESIQKQHNTCFYLHDDCTVIIYQKKRIIIYQSDQ